jgi:tetratricopeptide (TPR) repeat protein
VLAGTPALSQAPGEAGAQRAREAAVHLQRKQADKAVQLFTEALADQGLPNDRRASIYNDRGVAYSRLGQSRPAIEDFNRAVQLAPESASVYNNRGNVLLALGLAQEAVRDFDRAIVLAPGYAAAFTNRASALVQLGEPDAAIRDFSQAARLTPQNPAPLAGRGRVHLAQKRPHAALRDLNRAISADGRFGPGYRLRADVRLALGRYEEAVEDLSRAVAFDPTNLDLYLVRGYAYLAARNTASSVKDFARAAEISPRSAEAHAGLALANAAAGANEEALNDLAKAIEVDPRSATAYAYRAIVLKRMGHADAGQKDLERAVRLDSARPEVVWARGELAEAAGQTDEAVAEIKRALAAKPILREAAATLDRLGASYADETEVRELTFERWRVFVRQGQYHGVHPELGATVSVPLEMVSDGQPKLLEWDVKKPPHRGFAVLRFHAGQVDGRDGPEDVEHRIVVDLVQRSVIAVEPVRQGSRRTTWVWDEAKLTVEGLDGHKEEYQLKPGRGSGREVAQQPTTQPERRRVTDGNRGYNQGQPAWAPWNQGSGSSTERRRGQQPRSFFDMLFNN